MKILITNRLNPCHKHADTHKQKSMLLNNRLSHGLIYKPMNVWKKFSFMKRALFLIKTTAGHELTAQAKRYDDKVLLCCVLLLFLRRHAIFEKGL